VKNQNQKNTKGFTLIEIVVALAVIMLLAEVGARAAGTYFNNLANTQIAGHAMVLGRAGSAYIAANRSTLIAAAGPSTPVVVSVATLASTGFAPTGFSAVNQAGQTLALYIIEPTPGVIHGLLVGSGGEALDGLNARKVAQAMGAAGGYLDPGAPTKAKGAFNGWATNITPYGVAPGAGHVVFAVFVLDAMAAP